ncbi:OLC1v1015442C1 [Oldenlandia corymbosa var. corymbosa]|uniref:OLC1v1015442C1 n=1 Tax=Oldenlandia corymbosa var. corymbosa TaxID=529605 RepID=A0AAV1E394_OLDCO|nr:OLC1v1015442C1 [Oldenlandia corymbosa var. corymbosa]
MGNGFQHRNPPPHPHHHHHQESLYNKNSTFLPLLCRLSIRDVRLGGGGDYKDRSTSSSSSLSDDPSSPKVSCMGHVKKNPHQFIDFSTPYRLTAAAATTTATAMIKSSKPSSNRGPFQYTKLKRFFSGKNLLTTSSVTTTAAAATTTATASQVGRSRSCREIVLRRSGSRRSSKINNDDGGGDITYGNNDLKKLNISELDPPLPVPKKAAQPPSETNNLWKRRSGGMTTLRSLQIQQIHVPNNNHNQMHDQPAATTV